MQYPTVILLPFFGVLFILIGIWWLMRAGGADENNLVHAGLGEYYTSERASFQGLFAIVFGIVFILMGILL